MLILQAVALLNAASETVESLHSKMNELASTLPEYPVVMDMNGVGATLGPQFIAGIGDVSRFTHREALTAFSGVDPGKNDSGKHILNSMRTSKKGSPTCAKLFFRSWTVLSNDLQWMILFIPLWIKNNLKANLIMFTWLPGQTNFSGFITVG